MLKMHEAYIEVIALVEQLHRQFLDLVKLELDGQGIYDVSNVQALMLFNIGDAEMSIGDLILRGCYLGSNVSYNAKKLAENGYITHLRSPYDRRSVHVRLTEKGLELRARLQAMHHRHVELLNHTTMITADNLQAVAGTLRQFERFWNNVLQQSITAA